MCHGQLLTLCLKPIFNAKLFWVYFHIPSPADFEAAVTTALGTLGEKCSVQSRRYDDLDPFLFLPDEGFRQDYAAKQFDKVDMIFIGTLKNKFIASTHHALQMYARFNSLDTHVWSIRPLLSQTAMTIFCHGILASIK